MIGETIDGCRAEFFERRSQRSRKRVTVLHVGRNVAELRFPRGKAPRRVKLNGTALVLVAPDGRDLVAEWRVGPPRRPSVSPIPGETARRYWTRMIWHGLADDPRVEVHRDRLRAQEEGRE